MKELSKLAYCLICLTILSCVSTPKIRFTKAYNSISRDFFNKKGSIKEFGKNISGILVYDSIYKYPLDQTNPENVHNDILSRTSNSPIKRDVDLESLKFKNINKNWNLNYNFKKVFGTMVQYDSVPNGPLSVALFSEIIDNKLRVDILPFFVGKPKYCGSITKYYFKFIKIKLWNAKSG